MALDPHRGCVEKSYGTLRYTALVGRHAAVCHHHIDFDVLAPQPCHCIVVAEARLDGSRERSCRSEVAVLCSTPVRRDVGSTAVARGTEHRRVEADMAAT